MKIVHTFHLKYLIIGVLLWVNHASTNMKYSNILLFKIVNRGRSRLRTALAAAPATSTMPAAEKKKKIVNR